MTIFIQALLAAFIVSLISLAWAVLLKADQTKLNRALILMVSFSAGALLSTAFLHLLPEAIAINGNSLSPYLMLLAGFGLFFILEKVLRVHHYHEGDCDDRKDNPRHIGPLNLIGGGIHNFIDGLIIVSSFLVSSELGVAVTISIALHELPHELGDYGVLLYAGYSRLRALFYNFLTACLAMAGVVLGYYFSHLINGFTSALLPFAAGGFIYISATDLIPELHKDIHRKRSFLTFAIFVLAVALMWAIKIYSPGE